MGNSKQEVVIKKEPLKYENKYIKKGGNIFKDTFPPALIPTKRTETFFEVIIAVAILISVIELLSGGMMAGDMGSAINIGYPLPMISMSFEGNNDSIFKFGNLILDFLVYLGIAYIIDILIGLMFQKSEKHNDKHTLKVMSPKGYFTTKPMDKENAVNKPTISAGNKNEQATPIKEEATLTPNK